MRPSSPSIQSLFVACGLLAAACRVAPVAPLPEPYRETDGWSKPEAPSETFLGLETRENYAGSLDELFFEPGVKVTRVDVGSPAADAGIERGDVVLAFDGHELDSPATLAGWVAERSPGEILALRVRRGDAAFDVPVTLRSSGTPSGPSPSELWLVDRVRSRAAWRTRPGQVELVAAEPDSPFPRAGIPVGSRVCAVDGQATPTARRLVRTLQARDAGSKVRVDFHRTDGTQGSTRVRLFAMPRRVREFHVPILTHYEADASGEEVGFVLLDLWLISLFRYERDGAERRWRILRFLRFSSGVGELQ